MDRDLSSALVYRLPEDQLLQSLPVVKGTLIQDIASWEHFGFQGTNLYECYKILSQAIKEDYRIILAYTSNAISGGVREIITNLCKLKLVDGLVFTAGALEEDFMKCNHSFYINNQRNNTLQQNQRLRTAGINRTENLLISNGAYIALQSALTDIFTNKLTKTIVTPRAIAKNLANRSNESSFLYWAYKNKIEVFPLCVEDSAIGDFLIFESYRRKAKGLKPLKLDALSTLQSYYQKIVMVQKKTCAIILGSGTPKHYTINPFIAKGGLDLVLYINNGTHYDGSNGSATIQEAISWGKIKPSRSSIKLHGDFNILFPLLATQLIRDHTQT